MEDFGDKYWKAQRRSAYLYGALICLINVAILAFIGREAFSPFITGEMLGMVFFAIRTMQSMREMRRVVVVIERDEEEGAEKAITEAMELLLQLRGWRGPGRKMALEAADHIEALEAQIAAKG